MKTIFIPVYNRQQARNILRTDIFDELNKASDVRVVIFVPHFKLDAYIKEFNGKNLVIEGIEEPPLVQSKTDAFFSRISLFYIDTKTARFIRKKWILLENKEYFRYLISITMLTIFGGIKPLRTFMRFLDYHLVRDERYGGLFEKYKPDLVFLPNITSRSELSFLRHAKRRKVKSVGSINAWDNFTLAKYSFRLLPDRLIVHNKILKGEAHKYLNIKNDSIFVSGMPHFDHYVTKKRISREEFCRKVEIDPKKRIILFGSVALVNDTEWQVLSLLDDAMQNGKLPEDVVILLRHHPVTEMIRGDATYSDRVIFDDSKTHFKEGEKKYTEILRDDMDHLADTIYHCEMIISTCSTLSIDGSAFDKPIIDIGFDGWSDKEFHEGVEWFYTPCRGYYMAIVESGGVALAQTFEELLNIIHLYLKDPLLHQEGRKRIVEEQVYKLDGKSGKRVARFLLENSID